MENGLSPQLRREGLGEGDEAEVEVVENGQGRYDFIHNIGESIQGEWYVVEVEGVDMENGYHSQHPA